MHLFVGREACSGGSPKPLSCWVLLAGCTVVVRAPPRMAGSAPTSLRGAVFSRAFAVFLLSYALDLPWFMMLPATSRPAE